MSRPTGSRNASTLEFNQAFKTALLANDTLDSALLAIAEDENRSVPVRKKAVMLLTGVTLGRLSRQQLHQSQPAV